MATFTWFASRGSSKKVADRVIYAEFGDGYMQRVTAGINHIKREWQLEFAGRGQTEADAIEDFLIARGGSESFDWTDPRGHVGKWICRNGEFNRTPLAGTNSTITAVFEEVFGE